MGSVTALQPGADVTHAVRLIRQLGQGGMGSVWLAEHRGLGTNVVVKFMMAELALDAASVARFSREAAAASQVKSPHVVQTLDHGITAGGVPFIVMELLEGHDLAKHLAARGALSPDETLAIVDQLCKALDRAHQKGIVHRDIKPENIFLCDVGHGEVFVKLLDFGIAKTAEALGVGSATRTGVLIGTPYYMSPEQSLGSRSIDHRTDLWSVGVVTFECLTGKKPFDGDTITGLALALHHGPIPSPSFYLRGLPPAVDAWFARACSRNVAERPESARALSEELRQALGGAPRVSTENPVTPGYSSSWSGQGSALSTSTSSPATTAVPADLPLRSSQPLVLGIIATVLVAAGAFGAWKRFASEDAPPLGVVPGDTASVAPSAAAGGGPLTRPTEPAAPAVASVIAAPAVGVASPSSSTALPPARAPLGPTVKPGAPVKAVAPPKMAPAPPETKAPPKSRAANRDDIE
jgi:eukaryotic-like serine/threonine-protein kinase